jgi:hypothetical protein
MSRAEYKPLPERQLRVSQTDSRGAPIFYIYTQRLSFVPMVLKQSGL